MKAVSGTSSTPTSALKVLADPTRLRILALVDQEELSVGELSRALDLSQSRVSNHLRVLREAELLRERHAGTSTFLRMAHPRNGAALATRLWQALRDELDQLPHRGADLVRLETVLAERASTGDFFDRVADEWDKIAGAFESGQARERTALHALAGGGTIADLGCGTGYMGAALLGICERLIAVDRSAAMLEEAQKRLRNGARGTRVELRQGELDRLPIADGEVNGVVVGMVLHHLPELDRAFAEMRRVLAPGGSAAILELAPHRERWMRADLGDRHLGLEPDDVLAALARAGFTDLVLDPVEDRYRPRRRGLPAAAEAPSLSLFIARGRSPRTETQTRNETRP